MRIKTFLLVTISVIIPVIIGLILLYSGKLTRMEREFFSYKAESKREKRFLGYQIKKLEKDLAAAYIEAPKIKALEPLQLDNDKIENIRHDIPAGGTIFEAGFLVSSAFGEGLGFRSEPRITHDGVDIIPQNPGALDWDVYPFAPGKIDSIGIDRIHGKYVIIKHNDRVYTRYSHLSKIYYASSIGSLVDRSDAIGVMGDTGLASGKHLHLELNIKVNDNEYVAINPIPFLEKTAAINE